MKIGRNTPCWCGSGKKFKKCHLDKEQQSRVPRQEALDASRRARSERTCFHPDASADTCGAIIGAHSVQRSGGGLAAIARKGHVYGYRSDLSLLDKTGGRVAPKLIGIRDASTFAGFCDRHDSELFRPLESCKFEATPQQLALLGFRAICRDLMAKRSAHAFNPFLREIGDRGLSFMEQLRWQRKMMERDGGNTLALGDLENAKSKLQGAISTSNFSELHGVVWQFDKTPAVLAATPYTPEFDFEGALLQDLNNVSIPAEVLTFSMMGDGDGGGVAALVWMGDSPAAEKFSNSALRLRKDELPHRLVQFSLDCFENVFWSPEWWDRLDEPTQRKLIDRMNSQLDGIRDSDHLFDDGTRSADWVVTDVARV
jgi:hypothetical protein